MSLRIIYAHLNSLASADLNEFKIRAFVGFAISAADGTTLFTGTINRSKGENSNSTKNASGSAYATANRRTAAHRISVCTGGIAGPSIYSSANAATSVQAAIADATARFSGDATATNCTRATPFTARDAACITSGAIRRAAHGSGLLARFRCWATTI